jgi:hypothetical protein
VMFWYCLLLRFECGWDDWDFCAGLVFWFVIVFWLVCLWFGTSVLEGLQQEISCSITCFLIILRCQWLHLSVITYSTFSCSKLAYRLMFLFERSLSKIRRIVSGVLFKILAVDIWCPAPLSVRVNSRCKLSEYRQLTFWSEWVKPNKVMVFNEFSLDFHSLPLMPSRADASESFAHRTLRSSRKKTDTAGRWIHKNAANFHVPRIHSRKLNNLRNEICTSCQTISLFFHHEYQKFAPGNIFNIS